MPRPILISTLILPLLLACATASSRQPPADVDLMTYESRGGYMCGRCDSLKFSLATDGRLWIERGHWAGNYRNWQRQRRLVQIAPDKAREAFALLESYRPAPDAAAFGPGCAEEIHDVGGFQLGWRTSGSDKTLIFEGCRPTADMTVLADRIDQVFKLLAL